MKKYIAYNCNGLRVAVVTRRDDGTGRAISLLANGATASCGGQTWDHDCGPSLPGTGHRVVRRAEALRILRRACTTA